MIKSLNFSVCKHGFTSQIHQLPEMKLPRNGIKVKHTQ